MFKNMIIFQEYAVSDINPNCTNNRLKVDWYIKNLNVVIEVQGEHHYEPTTYGGISLDLAAQRYRSQVYKDINKINFLKEVNCPIIEVSPDDELTEEWLLKQINIGIQHLQSGVIDEQNKDSK